MHRTKILLLVVLSFASIIAQSEKKKTCLHHLVINGTNLITGHRKQLLVVGIINLANQTARNQANRYNDLYRELARHDIRESVVRLVLVNAQEAAVHYPTQGHLDKIRVFQDSPKDQLIKKLGQYGRPMNNLVFGRCGYLVFTQRAPNSNLLDGTHYQELLRIIMTAVKNKRRCQGLCS